VEVFNNFIHRLKTNPSFHFQLQIIPIIFYFGLWVVESNKEVLKSEKENNLLQLKLLKSKINPLIVNKAFDYIKSESTDLAQQMVLRLSSFLRYLLYESQKNANSIEAELDFLVNFLEIAEHSLNKELTIDYKIKKSGDNYHEMQSLALYPLLSEVLEKVKSFVDLNIFLENHLLTLKITFDLKAELVFSNFESVFIKEFKDIYAFYFSEEGDTKLINLVVDFNKTEYLQNENLQMLNS
jgi:hypothetical protein